MDHAVVPGSSYDFTTRSWGVSNLLRITKYAMIITGFSYASWHLLRSYVLPRFFNIPEPVEKRIHVIEGKVSFQVYFLFSIKVDQGISRYGVKNFDIISPENIIGF